MEGPYTHSLRVNPFQPDLTAAKAVAAGAAALDERRPGWERQVDLSALELQDSCRCVLGQIFKSFTTGISALQTDRAVNGGVWVVNHGFDIPAFTAHRRFGYAELEEMWIALVKERFDSGALSDSSTTD